MDAYLSDEPPASGFFPRRWRDPDAYLARARALVAGFDRAARERAARAIRTPATDERTASDRLDAWVEAGGLLVTTGQQPGLFGGPLYTVYKALTAVRLAEALERRLERPVLPLFWIASEDHDWDEAHETWVVGIDNDLHHLALEAPAERGRPLYRVPAGPSVESLRRQLVASLPESDFSAPLVELLENAWTPDAVLSRAFRETLEGLLAPFGMHFVEAHDPALKRASVDILSRELERSSAHEALLRDRADALESAGYHVQVPVLEGGVNLFLEGEHGRERLYRDDGGLQLRHSGRILEEADVARILEEDPGRVSPNVLLRPVVESAVFPTVAYVAGPGEMAYFAQLAPLFDAHGVDMPVVYPRFSATVVEGKVGKVLEKFDLDVPALQQPFHELAGRIAREEVPEGVQRALGRLKGAIGEGTAALTEAARTVDPTLKGPIARVRTTAFEALDEAERKIVQALKRENDIALQQLEKARLHLFPEGNPQERMLNPFYYLFRYGDRFLQDVASRFDPALPVAARRE